MRRFGAGLSATGGAGCGGAGLAASELSVFTVTFRVRLSENAISSTSSNTWRAVRSGWVVLSMTRATKGGTNGRIQRAAALVASGIDGISGARSAGS